MPKILRLLFLFFIAPHQLMAQITPAEGSGLNYRIIGLSFPQVKGADTYTIEIAGGNYSAEDYFQKNIISNVNSKKNKIIAEVPDFGAQYTWRVITNGHSTTTKSDLHHFSTLMAPQVDTDSTRLRIIVPAEKNKDAYIFIDGIKTLYDMNGRAVWYLRDIEKPVNGVLSTRDLKRSTWGTITFMMKEHLYEINYNGDILWKEPENDSMKRIPKAGANSFHHHEFSHLANGHYMTLGMEKVPWELPDTIDTSHLSHYLQKMKDSIGKIQQKIVFGRIIEFDKKHNVVWSWSATDYLKQSDLYYRRDPNGLFKIVDTHENAFYFDEKAKTIYVSFRNISRIIKLQYPSGKVLNTYGAIYTPGDLELKNDFFCGQHCCRKSQEGYLYMYNNNTCNRRCGQLPTILMLQEPLTRKEQLKKVWEYECAIDDKSEQEQLKLDLTNGGSVFELPDRSILCCMGGTYGKVFIVSHDKKILWSALPEQWNIAEGKWEPISGYRASIISRKELESLVWGEPLKK